MTTKEQKEPIQLQISNREKNKDEVTGRKGDGIKELNKQFNQFVAISLGECMKPTKHFAKLINFTFNKDVCRGKSI